MNPEDQSLNLTGELKNPGGMEGGGEAGGEGSGEIGDGREGGFDLRQAPALEMEIDAAEIQSRMAGLNDRRLTAFGIFDQQSFV